jgi:hypothetical protein
VAALDRTVAPARNARALATAALDAL